MSLKAKLEAVIYAAEEPVTLAQLAMLFSNEALEWKAEQEAARAAEEAQNAEALAGEPAELPLAEPPDMIAEPPDEVVAEAPAADAPVSGAIDVCVDGETPETSSSEDGSPDLRAPESSGQENTEAGTMIAAESAESDPAGREAAVRRAARQREREVRTILREILDEIIDSFAADGRGVEIREIAGGYRMATKPECHDAVRLFVKSLKPALKLSLPALETLAVIAYKQPVTAPEVNEIRGVDSSGVFGSLLARKLIATAGRKQVIGRPILYKTTKEFLLRFGLKDISELPSMEEFEKMAAGELDELSSADSSTEQAASGNSLATGAGELDETVSDETLGEDEAGVSAAGPAPDSEARPASQPSAESPESESESNPSEAAPLNAESSAE